MLVSELTPGGFVFFQSRFALVISIKFELDPIDQTRDHQILLWVRNKIFSCSLEGSREISSYVSLKTIEDFT